MVWGHDVWGIFARFHCICSWDNQMSGGCAGTQEKPNELQKKKSFGFVLLKVEGVEGIPTRTAVIFRFGSV